MDKYILRRLTKYIWTIGFLTFIYTAFPHLWGTLRFVNGWISSFINGIPPSESSALNASAAFAKLIPVIVLCIITQLTVLATPFITTGSKSLIDFYYEREADYAKTVSKRIELSKQISNATEQLKFLHSEIQQCRALLSQLGHDTETLTNAVALSRKTLTAQIKKNSKLNNKGDF